MNEDTVGQIGGVIADVFGALWIMITQYPGPSAIGLLVIVGGILYGTKRPVLAWAVWIVAALLLLGVAGIDLQGTSQQ